VYLQYLQALDAPVVHGLDGDAPVFALLKGQRDCAAIGFDQVGVNVGFEDAGQPRPAYLGAGQREVA
jgi:hypothetical protein